MNARDVILRPVVTEQSVYNMDEKKIHSSLTHEQTKHTSKKRSKKFSTLKLKKLM